MARRVTYVMDGLINHPLVLMKYGDMKTYQGISFHEALDDFEIISC